MKVNGLVDSRHIVTCNGRKVPLHPTGRNGEFVAKFEDPIDLDRATFMSLKQEVVLARLLSERARAHAAGREADERALRAQIRIGLPVRRGDVQP